MRNALALLTIVGLAVGCAPKFAAKDESPVLSSPGNVTPIYNAQKEPSAVERSVSAVRDGSAKLVNWTKPEPQPHSEPLADSLSLNHMPANVSPNLHLSMGKMMEKQGNIASAEKHFQEGLAQAPQDASLLLAYAHLLDRQGRFADAKEKYIAAAKSAPQDARIHNDLGLCFARHQELDRSVEALAYAVKLAPQKALYRNNIATVLMEMDRKEEAWQHLKAAHPPAVAHYNFAFLLTKKQDNAAAFQHFAHAARLDPNMDAARHWASRLQAHAPRPDYSPRPEAPAEPTGPSLGAPSASQARYPEPLPESANGDRYRLHEANAESQSRHPYYAPR